MKRNMLKSKIHRATVTEANVEYEGSITIDSNLLAAADILDAHQPGQARKLRAVADLDANRH